MQTIRTILFVIFVLDSILLVLAVLVQSGRGGGLAGALGGIGSADSALGARAATQIEKATGVLAAIFLATALALAFVPALQAKAPEVEVGPRPGMDAATTEPAASKTSTQPAGAAENDAVGAKISPARKTD